MSTAYSSLPHILRTFYLLIYMQVNIDGVLSFGDPFRHFSPELFPLSNHEDDVLIAPFWDDIETRDTGDIYFRFSEEEPLINQIGKNISDAFKVSFTPSSLFIATWDGVVSSSGPNYKVNLFIIRIYVLPM